MNQINPQNYSDAEDLISTKIKELGDLLESLNVPFLLYTISPNKKNAAYVNFSAPYKTSDEILNFYDGLNDSINEMSDGILDVSTSKENEV